MSRERQICVVENGRAIAWGPHKVDTRKPLYAIVDLLGNTTGATIVSNAKPPDSLKEHYEAKTTKRRSSVKDAMMKDADKHEEKLQNELEKLQKKMTSEFAAKKARKSVAQLNQEGSSTEESDPGSEVEEAKKNRRQSRRKSGETTGSEAKPVLFLPYCEQPCRAVSRSLIWEAETS